jgi:hypothetical protein
MTSSTEHASGAMSGIPDDIRDAARNAALGHGIDGRDLDDLCADIAEAILAERNRMKPHLHLIRVFVNDMTERNWGDKQAYILQQLDRICGEV